MSDSKPSTPKRTVLITGCSDGGLGAALATAFHKAGLHVIATARNIDKMKKLGTLGIELLTLDVESESSIAECVSKVDHIDILLNNAGAAYAMPVSDMSITEAKKLFDLNVWSYLAVTQAFLPLLLKSRGLLVNQTSISSVVTVPFQGAYHASKSAIAIFSDTQRLELEPFGITVVDLKTGAVQSNITQNQKETRPPTLPKNSIYQPAREAVEFSMSGEGFMKDALKADVWADGVVRSLLKKSPPPNIWTGGMNTFLVRLGSLLPFGSLDGTIRKMTGLDVVRQKVGK